MPDRKRKKPLVPKLRFPEFEDAGEWEICKLGDLLSLEYGFSLPDSRRKDGEIPVIGSNGIVGFHDEAFIDGPAIIIGRKGSVGQVNWIDRGCCPIDTTFYVQRQREDCLLMFLKLILDVAKLSERGDKGAVPGLNRNDVYTIKTALPLEAEQQKIADCLSSLDELIELEAQKCEALKAHKKGLMQQLFPRENETIPRLRFPEFRDAGPWGVKQLKQVCSVNPACCDLPYRFIYIDLESVVSGRLAFEKEISKDGAPSRAKRLLRNGDVIYQMVRPYQKNNLLCKFSDNKEYVASTGYAQLRPNWSSEFLFQIVHTDVFVNKVLSKCTGSNYPAIKASDLADIGIAYPKPAEQQKTADCLSSLDKLIELQSRKVEALKRHKKGLMQQLFPQEVI